MRSRLWLRLWMIQICVLLHSINSVSTCTRSASTFTFLRRVLSVRGGASSSSSSSSPSPSPSSGGKHKSKKVVESDSNIHSNNNITNSTHGKIQLYSNHDIVVRKNTSPILSSASSSESSSILHKLQKSLSQSQSEHHDHDPDPDPTTILQSQLHPHLVSIYSIQGKRAYMEDEYFTNQDGSFCAIFDGHGGKAVSRYLRQNLYARFLQARATATATTTVVVPSSTSTSTCTNSLNTQEEGKGMNYVNEDKEKLERRGRGNGRGDTFGKMNNGPQNGTTTTMKHMKKILNSKLASSSTTSTIATTTNFPKGHGRDKLSSTPTSTSTSTPSSIFAVQSSTQALTSAFEKIDTEVNRISHWSFQGSTAVAVLLCQVQVRQGQNDPSTSPLSHDYNSIHKNGASDDDEDDDNDDDDDERDLTIKPKNRNRNRTILISANVGDSRAVLSHSGKAIDLTRDHKPNDPLERKRIEALGGKVKWCGPIHPQTGKPITKFKYSSSTSNNKKNYKQHGNSLSTTRRGLAGVYRINGNLALSRAIGDRSERPLVSSEVEIQQIELDSERDEFIILASDGLWDVMSSQEVVDYCHDKLGEKTRIDNKQTTVDFVKKAMAQYLVYEALKRGSMDNISVIVIWFRE